MDKLYTLLPTVIAVMRTTARLLPGMYSRQWGFYPVCPGTDEYVFGYSLLQGDEAASGKRKDGDYLCSNNGDDKRYISSMKLNGKRIYQNYLTHQDLLNGASISFKMDAKPNQQRGTKETDFPYSF